jgi:hypothetical protein
MKTSNWPSGTDFGHANYTGRTPRTSRYDGVGSWAKDSHKIPLKAIPCAIAVLGLLAFMVFAGSAVGF